MTTKNLDDFNDFPETTKRLIQESVSVLRGLGVDYCIGGAVAMAAYGYLRATRDVDVFVRHTDMPKIRNAFQSANYVVREKAEDLQYLAIPDWITPAQKKAEKICLDILCPGGDPELSAVEAPEQFEWDGRAVEIMPVELLVISKFQAFVDGHQRQGGDVQEMFRCGAFRIGTVSHIIKLMNDSELLQQWNTFAGLISKPAKPNRKGWV